jgi:DNA-binding CsgD family transcriptional regulator/PAS domain-containing protein
MLGNRDILTDRESEVIRLATSGMTDKQVAGSLGVSTSTITTYWFRIKMKLNARSRSEAIAKYAMTTLSLGRVSDGHGPNRFWSFTEAPFVAWTTDSKGTLKQGYGNLKRYVSMSDQEPSEVEWQRFASLMLSPDEQQVLSDDGKLSITRKYGPFVFEIYALTSLRSDHTKDVFIMALDVTKHLEITNQLEDHHRFVQDIVDHSPTMTVIWNIKSEKVVFVNSQAYYYLGYSCDEILALKHGILDLIDPEDMKGFRHRISQVGHSRAGDIRHVSFHITTSEGSPLFLEGKCSPYRTSSLGVVEELILVCYEAGDACRKVEQLKKQLAATQERLDQALGSIDSTPCAMAIVRETGEVIRANGAALMILGADRDGWSSVYRTDALDCETPPKLLTLPADWVSPQVLSRKPYISQVVELPDLSGTSKSLILSVVPVRGRDGDISSYSLSFIEYDQFITALDRYAPAKAIIDR